MIERLPESTDAAFGFKASGSITAADVDAFTPQVAQAISRRGKRTIGVLADLGGQGVSWKRGSGDPDCWSTPRASRAWPSSARTGGGGWRRFWPVRFSSNPRPATSTTMNLHAWHWVRPD
jgi:hypothetical protein